MHPWSIYASIYIDYIKKIAISILHPSTQSHPEIFKTVLYVFCKITILQTAPTYFKQALWYYFLCTVHFKQRLSHHGLLLVLFPNNPNLLDSLCCDSLQNISPCDSQQSSPGNRRDIGRLLLLHNDSCPGLKRCASPLPVLSWHGLWLCCLLSVSEIEKIQRMK